MIEKALMIGSCFANEIGQKLLEDGYNVNINPFGTLFNPISILNSIERLNSQKLFTAKEVNKFVYGKNFNGEPIAKYGSFYHYTLFSRDNQDEFLSFVNTKLINDAKFFKEADTVIITLGTSWVFRHIKKDIIVSNCHKMPAKEFKREFIGLEQCISTLSNIIKYPDKKYIFTVSPVRHLSDGPHSNQISKATLILAIDTLIKKYSDNFDIGYFPAYEILLDDLRDYRYYAQDKVHPSEEAVAYIYEKFRQHYL